MKLNVLSVATKWLLSGFIVYIFCLSTTSTNIYTPCNARLSVHLLETFWQYLKYVKIQHFFFHSCYCADNEGRPVTARYLRPLPIISPLIAPSCSTPNKKGGGFRCRRTSQDSIFMIHYKMARVTNAIKEIADHGPKHTIKTLMFIERWDDVWELSNSYEENCICSSVIKNPG